MTTKRAAEANSAINSIRIELTKSTIVILLIIALGIWQFDFAYKSVLSHPQLNLLIIFTFVGGVVSAFIAQAGAGCRPAGLHQGYRRTLSGCRPVVGNAS